MLDQLENILINQDGGALVREGWRHEVAAWSKRVAKARRYENGEQRVRLTPKMQKMLRIDNDESGFLANYCRLVVRAVADRMKLSKVEAVSLDMLNGRETNTEEAQKWADLLLKVNRFDQTELMVTEATIRDGDSFIMLDWDEDSGYTRLAHEPAFDGDVGLIPVYDRYVRNIIAAIKIWYEPGYDGKRVNIYYTDRIERYVAGKTGLGLSRLEADPNLEAWTAGVVPVVHYRNHQAARSVFSHSEIDGVYTLQDALNRFLTSAVMTAELTAFRVPYAIGWVPPEYIEPGAWISISKEPLTREQQIEIGQLEQGSVIEFINMMNWVIEQMSVTTSTPIPGLMGGDTSSGEALKQREIGLIGKVQRLQTSIGNSHEDVLKMAAVIQNTFGTKKAPDVQVWDAKWDSAEIRNDSEIIDNALKVRAEIPASEFLSIISQVYGWDAKKIDSLQAERADEQRLNFESLAQTALPGLSEFGNSLNGNRA